MTSATAVTQGTVHAISKSKYSRAHSLGESYQFQPRDGWQSVNITDLQYKYPAARSHSPSGGTLEKRGGRKGRRHTQTPPHQGNGGKDLGGAIVHILGEVWNGLKAIGQPEPVIITWYVEYARRLSSRYLILQQRYTGHDLLNPSCWSDGKWHPTVSSANFTPCSRNTDCLPTGRFLCRCAHTRGLDNATPVL